MKQDVRFTFRMEKILLERFRRALCGAPVSKQIRELIHEYCQSEYSHNEDIDNTCE